MKDNKIHYFVYIYILMISIYANETNNNSSLIQGLLNTELNELKTTPYKQMYHKPINVSIGEQLYIVLPSFDSVYNKQNVGFRILSDQQYQGTLKKLQTIDVTDQDIKKQDNKQKNHKDQKQMGQKVQLKDLPMKCKYIPANARVYETISKVNDESGTARTNHDSKHYVHISSRQLLYILNSQTMILSAYYYNDLNIKFLSSFQLPRSKIYENENSINAQTRLSVAISANSKQSQLYIFSSEGIWIVQTKTYLTNIKQIHRLSGFSPVDTLGIDKVVHGSSQYFVAMKKMSKVYIIPQKTQGNTNQKKYIQINKFKEQSIFPQDISLQGSYLFVLDVFKGVYIYQILSDGSVNQLFKIIHNTYGGNYKLHVYHMNTIFINFNDFDGSKIVQINIDIENQKADLVRYFKNDDYVSYIQTYSVLTSSTGFYLNQIQSNDDYDIKQIQNSAQSLLFMVSNNQDIYLFPFNVDPRTITSLQNGVKIHYPNVQQILHIFGDLFLIITQDTIDYVKILIQKPQISCLIGSQYNQNYKVQTENMQIIVKSNMTTCEYRNRMSKHKIFYNQNCQITTSYVIHLNDPEQSNIRKLITYGIVLLVVTAFILGLFCLIQWRNQKLVVLSRLKDQILRFRNRHRRMQPFVQEQIDQRKQVQMEVPKDIEYIQNDQQQ